MKNVQDIFSEYKLFQKDIEIPLQQLKNDLAEYKNSIVLYGAGSAGIAFLHYLHDVGISPAFFADGDTQKQGTYCENVEIIPPEQIIRRVGVKSLIIVTINTDGKSYCKDFKAELLAGGHQGVHQRLRECGCENIVDYTYFRRCYQLFRGEKYNLPACNDVYLMQEKQYEIEQVYRMLEDDISKAVFLAILEFRMLTDKIEIPTLPEKGMYFEYKLFDKFQDEVFVDCGACGGSSLREFLEISHKQFGGYYGIEPDLQNYHLLIEYINTLNQSLKRRMQIVNAAAYSHNDGVNFYILNGPGSFQSKNGPDWVKTITIDDFLQGERATYIKMNIEGSEVAALKGAEYTISRFKPRLAIMGYHKTSDFWEVPLLIKKLNNEYKLDLRSYMHNVAFPYYAY